VTTMSAPKTGLTRKEAGMSYLSAHVAHRDSKRLLSIGLAACVQDASRRLREKPKTLDEAVEAVAIKEAADLVELYEQDPIGFSDGRTADAALAAGFKLTKKRYRNGKCALCKGPALPCAIRHARGRSCA